MSKTTITRILVASTVVAATISLTPTLAMAREGAQSVGKGIKCYQASVLQSNGTYQVKRICYKGV